jgi:hypothetical protein
VNNKLGFSKTLATKLYNVVSFVLTE